MERRIFQIELWNFGFSRRMASSLHVTHDKTYRNPCKSKICKPVNSRAYFRPSVFHLRPLTTTALCSQISSHYTLQSIVLVQSKEKERGKDIKSANLIMGENIKSKIKSKSSRGGKRKRDKRRLFFNLILLNNTSKNE
jgi:hypothetical protein